MVESNSTASSAGARHPGERFILHRRILGIVVLALTFVPPPAWGQSTTVEPRTPNNLLVCSWNIKWFRDSGRELTKLAKVIAPSSS
jgi:hypothetical protein